MAQPRVEGALEASNDRVVREARPARAGFARKEESDICAVSSEMTGELVGRASVGPRGQDLTISRSNRDIAKVAQKGVGIFQRRIERLLNPWSFAIWRTDELARLVNWGRAPPHRWRALPSLSAGHRS
jgi:hypothetical protein